MKESIILPPDARESGIKVRPPQGCEIDEVKVVDGFLTVTFKEKERQLPKSWKEFCEMFPVEAGECFINTSSEVVEYRAEDLRGEKTDRNILPDRATAEAILTLCQLIQLRNVYNGDWVPDWNDDDEEKYTIEFRRTTTIVDRHEIYSTSPLYFKTEELRDEFLRNFRPLIEKLKPLYGIKEGGEE